MFMLQMKKYISYAVFSGCLAFSGLSRLHAQTQGLVASTDNRNLAAEIMADTRLDSIEARALQLLHGFNAGTSYGEVWIRDFNTFINGSMRVQPPAKVREMLLLFFKLQGADGNIVDGFIDSTKANVAYPFLYSPLAPGWAAHKNTVETDQESSLIQAMRKYIQGTGDSAVLREVIGGKTVISRMEAALRYVRHYRWSEKYGLVTGATTVDWGDVQPESGWGVRINDHTKWAIDIYDNAMYALAIRDFQAVLPRDYRTEENWSAVGVMLKRQVRKYLWKPDMQKYIPHLYLDGSPFPAFLREERMLFTGGSACAILAGFNTKQEIAAINGQMKTAAASEPFATIGVTVYPPYPDIVFPNMKAYIYQNAGDWTWFGGRMIVALAENGYVKEAWEELQPIIARTIKYNGFFEWYDIKTGQPKGSGDFRGEAGVYYDVIQILRKWASSISK
ncbi:glucosidase family protein [Flavitalea flava]